MIPSPRTILRAAVVALGLALTLAAGAAQAQYSRPAQQVIARARAASGGSGWNYLRGWHETGRIGAAPYEAWYDPVRFGMRVETHEPGGGVDVHGFNGFGDWRITALGQVTGVDDAATVGETRTQVYLTVQAYLYPGRFDATGRYVGQRRIGGQAFDVLEVTPWHARPCELWFDRRTGLLARTVDRAGGRPVVTLISDYRKVGPVRVPFHFSIEGGGNGGDRQIESLTFAPADRAIFSLPRP